MANDSWVAVFVNRTAQLVGFKPDNPEAFQLAPPCKVGDEGPESPCSRATKEQVNGNWYVDGKPTGPASFEYQNYLAYRRLFEVPNVVKIPNGATNVRCFETVGIHYHADNSPNDDPAHHYYVAHTYQCFFTPSLWAKDPIRSLEYMIVPDGTIYTTKENFDSMAAVYNLYKAEMEKELGK